jgi:4,5-dihydroxyphthalate decarboxylase
LKENDMADLKLACAIKDYDHIAPLRTGDVRPEGIDLTFDFGPDVLNRVINLPEVSVGELSFGRYLIRLASGDDSIVGLPIFTTCLFRQRCFYVAQESPRKSLKDLAGARVGTNEWPATGNTWARAALREQGVEIEGIRWSVGTVDAPSPGSVKDPLPSHVQPAPAGRSLRQMLLDGELDALMIAYPPEGFYGPSSPVRRLIPDWVGAEKAYLRRVGYIPAHHVMGVKRALFEQNSWVVKSLFDAFQQSKRAWQEGRLKLTDTTPWVLDDIEQARKLVGEDWQPYGVVPNRKVIAALCEEQYAQGLVERPFDPAKAFADFERVVPGV